MICKLDRIVWIVKWTLWHWKVLTRLWASWTYPVTRGGGGGGGFHFHQVHGVVLFFPPSFDQMRASGSDRVIASPGHSAVCVSWSAETGDKVRRAPHIITRQLSSPAGPCLSLIRLHHHISPHLPSMIAAVEIHTVLSVLSVGESALSVLVSHYRTWQ